MSKITGSRQREVTKEFLRLKSHFLFEDHFCLVRRANEKGHVDRLLDFARTNYLVPVPEVASLIELNAELLRRCQADLDRQLYGKPAPKAVLLEEERPSLLPLPPQEFEARRVKLVEQRGTTAVGVEAGARELEAELRRVEPRAGQSQGCVRGDRSINT